ncbi:peptide chain release factor N(5)-glutamine methyltransferase [Leptolyngbya sp. FACHB-16]|nr:peptide chain release factor N(5)-glutamine methyltransferase [Leptolyngbya sp. FACHB-8]MBD2155359.1 peptide chain release factor N(5)-glutamine methyltransferase [Leptolyngbya sp. FACHB-16]
MSGSTLWQWHQLAQEQAIAAHIPPYEVDWLLQELADLNGLELRLGTLRDRPAVSLFTSLEALQQLWQQRLTERVPIQYLAGRTPWRQFSLRVTPAVLIPRPETEEIIDLVLKLTSDPEFHSGHWVDLGTGSGAIALGLASIFSQAHIHAVDVSPEALAVAKQNAIENGLGDRIQFHQGEWFSPLTSLHGQLCGMVSNPPYIPRAVITTLEPEVMDHEPHLALDGGEDGLNAIRHLVHVAPNYLKPGGIWVIEMMAGQGVDVAELLRQNGHYQQIAIHHDLSGNERFASAQRV